MRAVGLATSAEAASAAGASVTATTAAIITAVISTAVISTAGGTGIFGRMPVPRSACAPGPADSGQRGGVVGSERAQVVIGRVGQAAKPAGLPGDDLLKHLAGIPAVAERLP